MFWIIASITPIALVIRVAIMIVFTDVASVFKKEVIVM